MTVSTRRSILIGLLAIACGQRHSPSFTLACTTSLEGSGLLPVLSQEFRRDTGIEIHAHVVGSGRALRLAERCLAEVVITHDPEAERQFVAKHGAAMYRPLMRSRFVIAGPRGDPAAVGSAASAAEAFRRIHAAGARFCSRADSSATHTRELKLWSAAGLDPAANTEYRRMGSSMSHLLRAADELQAYTLSDTATLAAMAPQLRNLTTLYRSDEPALENVYSVMLTRCDQDAAQYRNAEKFVRWLLGKDGRALITSYRIRGEPQFLAADR